MIRLIVDLVAGGVLFGLGWAAGAAQMRAGDFELRIDAPGGATEVECVRGCGLIGMRDLPNPRAGQMLVYNFDCGGARCRAFVAGFIRN